MVLKNIKGSVLVEFALVVPILIVLILGVHDIANYVVAAKNAEKIAKTGVVLPSRLQALSEVNVDVKTNEEDAEKKLFQNLMEASKMLFYTSKPDLSETNLPSIVLCWSLVECTKNKNGTSITIPWRVFIRLENNSISLGKISFRKDDYEIQTRVSGNNPPLKFKDYTPLLGTTNDYKLAYKIPEREGKMLVLEVFDNKLMRGGAFLSGFVPKSWFNVHKIAYNVVSGVDLPSTINPNIDEILDVEEEED